MPGTSTIETKRKDRVLQVATSAEIVDLYGRLGLEQTASDLAHNACVCFDELGGGLSAAPAITREDIHDYYSSLLQDWLSSYTPLDTHLREAGVVQYPNYAVETDFSRFPTPIDLAGVFSLELRFETGLVAGWHPSVSEEHVEEATKAGTPVEGTVIGTQGIALTWRQVWGRLLEAYNRVNEAALLIEELRQAPADKQVQVLESLRDELGRAREEITELVVDVQTSMLLEISIGKISSAYDIVVRLIEEIVPSPEVTTLSLAETELGRLDNAFVALNQDLAYVMSQVMYVTPETPLTACMAWLDRFTWPEWQRRLLNGYVSVRNALEEFRRLNKSENNERGVLSHTGRVLWESTESLTGLMLPERNDMQGNLAQNWLDEYVADAARVCIMIGTCVLDSNDVMDVEYIRTELVRLHQEISCVLDHAFGGDINARSKYGFTQYAYHVDNAIIDMERRRLFSKNQSIMMRGLETRVTAVENPADMWRMNQVLEAFRPYAEGKQLPPGTTPQIMRFLVVSAGVPGLWRRMDEANPGYADALIGYYAEGLSTVELTKKMPDVKDHGMAGYLVRQGMSWLWKHLPDRSDDFPIDKHTEFAPEELQSSRGERRRAASAARVDAMGWPERGREFALRRWGLPAEDESNSASPGRAASE